MANAYLQQQTPTQRDPHGLSAQAASSSRAVERAHSTASQFIKEKGMATGFEIRYMSGTDSQTILLVVQLLPLLSCKVLAVITSWSNHQAVE